MNYEQKTPTKKLLQQTCSLIFRTPFVTAIAIGFMVLVSLLYSSSPYGVIMSTAISILIVDMFYSIVCFFLAKHFQIKNLNLKTMIKYSFSQSWIQYSRYFLFFVLILIFSFFFIVFFINIKSIDKPTTGLFLFDGLLSTQSIYLIYLIFTADIRAVAFVYPPVIAAMSDYSFDETRVVAKNIILNNHYIVIMIANLMFGLLAISLVIPKIANLLLIFTVILNSIYYFLQVFKMVFIFDALGYNLTIKQEQHNHVENLSMNNA